jgi:FkbM family methyltransferase
MRLHRLRFEKSARRSSFLDAELQAFHTRVLLPLTMRGWVRIYLLRVSGRAIAALYGFMVRKKFFYYQSGTDPAWLRAGAGAACIAGVIEHCISCGAVEYDFLRGEEEYKRYWTRTTRQDSTFRLFDARIASRLELARLKLIDIARSLKKSLQTGIASGFMRRFVSVRALLARVLRAVISLIKLRKRTGLRATAQWIHFRLRSVLGAHEAPSLRLWPRHVEHPLTARLRGSSDLSVFWEIFVDEPFSSLQDLENVSVIFDLGANVGFSSAYFLSCFPKARVLAVEPDARNAAVCLKNLEPYKDRVLLLHGAVWAECTELCLATKGTAGHPRECATQVATPSAGGVGNIQAWDMESLIDMAGGAQVDLLKIDIEGSELALFRAQAASWLTRVRNLCIELHGEECRNAFLNALAGFDYELEHAGYLTICRNLRRATRLEEPIIPLCKHAGVGAQN